ncbi:unnamed protein product [Coffea canephora]|uniref:Rhodanese domain-containing protein n=1 Tax=Coffea canephora TaxID=49390 RepID=A0A068TRF2_COFCA|nr:unnamed protein product [Coffea canephora]
MSGIVISSTSQKPRYFFHTSKISAAATSSLKSRIRAFPFLPLCGCKFELGCKRNRPFSWECKRSFEICALSSNSQGNNWVRVQPEKDENFREEDEFVVVNFYHFVFIEDPQEEVSKHLSFMQGRNIHGRIYLNEQGINAQYSGPAKDALAYAKWVKEDHRFAGVLVQISPVSNGHAFPRLRLRYKPSLLEGGISHLPLLEPSIRAIPLTPSQWRNRLEALNKVNDCSNGDLNGNCILLDVRNGYEWDVGHFQGAPRPDVDCFRSTSFGLSDSMVSESDPLAAIDKEKTDVLMYCTGGIRCDVYSAILRGRGFKRLYTLMGGISHYLKSEGSAGWVGNLFVFDARLALPPPVFKPEVKTEACKTQAFLDNSFAKCYICGSKVSELRHRNCANLDCNLLFLCCTACVNQLRGCCCLKCTSAARLRPVLPGHQRYQKWHHYREVELDRR